MKNFRILLSLAIALACGQASAQAKQFKVAQGSITGTYGQAFGELSSACSTESLPLTPAFPDGKGDGTWVLCLDPKTGEDTPTYVEPKVIVSTFPLN